MNAKYGARPGTRVAQIAETHLFAIRFIGKRQFITPPLEVRSACRGIPFRLLGNPDERCTGRLCFENADRFAIHKEHVISKTVLNIGFTKSDTGRGMKIEPAAILHKPAGGG